MSVQIVFNLFFNTMCSLWAGSIVVFLSIRLFRIKDCNWKLGLLIFPFVKILYDLLQRGIPTTSIIHSGVNPLNLPPHSQILMLGGGFGTFGPIFNLVFMARLPDGKKLSTSVGDYMFVLCGKFLGTEGPRFILTVFLIASALLILLRFGFWFSFEAQRRRRRLHDIFYHRENRKLGFVDIYISRSYEGSPFTGGFFAPYICIPEKTFQLLSRAELDAVILHELSHVKRADFLITLCLGFLADCFWFIPGYRYLWKRVDRLREILADDLAIASGANPGALASALLRVQQIGGPGNPGVHSAFFRSEKIVSTRVRRLLNPLQKRRNFSTALQFVIVSCTLYAVLFTTFGGNHEILREQANSWHDYLPFGLGMFLRALGF